MNFGRLAYYSALFGGWMALFGWLVAELVFFRTNWFASGDAAQAIAVSAVVGAAIGAGVMMVGGLANGRWQELLRRAVPGLLGGALGGMITTVCANFLYISLSGWASGSSRLYEMLPRAIGWTMFGAGVGAVEGIYEQSLAKLRNGLLGGAIGGLIGGLLFDPLQWLVNSSSGMSSRATAFVVLGSAIGLMIGLAQVVFRHAWLSVADGYRVGRQLILSQPVTKLGRGDHLPLPFLGPANQELAVEHAQIVRQPDGAFALEDLNTALGTRLNHRPIAGRALLKDGDVIKLGPNSIRFNERRGAKTDLLPPTPGSPMVKASPPPPPPKAPPPKAAMPPKLPTQQSLSLPARAGNNAECEPSSPASPVPPRGAASAAAPKRPGPPPPAPPPPRR